MPQVGFGTSPLVGDEARAAVGHAIAAGYRLIDTSEQYGNEDAVGAAIADSGLAREEIFLTSKFNLRWHGEDLVREAYEGALERLGVEYLDLFLIHWPNPWLDRYPDAWRGLLELLAAGRVRAIGTSNFKPSHLERLQAETGRMPAVNQIELDPTLPQAERRRYHAEHGIVTQAWSPLGRGGTLLGDPTLLRLAAQHEKSPAQIVLRWHLEQGVGFVARSSDPGRIAENIDLFDFQLGEEGLAALRSLDAGREPARDSDSHGH